LLWLGITALISQLATAHLNHQSINYLYLKSLVLIVPWYCIFLFFCLANFHVCRWLPARETPFAKLLAFHLLAVTLCLVLWLLFGAYWSRELHHFGLHSMEQLFEKTIIFHAMVAAILYALWVLVHYMYLLTSQAEQDRSEQLRKQLLISDIELKAVKAAVHPHFMYNSLNMLANLSLVAPEKIHDICVQMSDFLRYSVNYAKKDTVCVADEVKHIENYLAIERERFGEHLQVELNIDEHARACSVMPLLLFPLVENAIKHGIGSQLEQGFVKLSIQERTGVLNIHVENSFDPQGKKEHGTGVGLPNLEKRLRAYYGSQAQLQIQREESIFKVDITIYRQARLEVSA